MLARRTVAVLVALCSVAVAVVATPGSAYLELAALPTLDCKIVNTPTNITIKVINKCGGNVNIRTCPLKFDHCVGYPKEPNYYQDCTQRIASGATEDLVLDTQRRYIVLNCPNWWGPGIDNWWTVEPSGTPAQWPASFTVPAPKNQTSARVQ